MVESPSRSFEELYVNAKNQRQLEGLLVLAGVVGSFAGLLLLIKY
jgi:hypothetical protein